MVEKWNWEFTMGSFITLLPDSVWLQPLAANGEALITLWSLPGRRDITWWSRH
jgi:hypothetical protein